MDKKDFLGQEIKIIMEEDTNNLNLSPNTIDKILSNREKTLKDRINQFLNKEIEIPLAPAVVGFAALLVISILPMDILKYQEVNIINIGSSQVFIRGEKEVSKR